MSLLFMFIQVACACSILSFPKSGSVYDQILSRATISDLAPLIDPDHASTKKFVNFLVELYNKSENPHAFLKHLTSIRFSQNFQFDSKIQADGQIVIPKLLANNPLALAEAYRLIYLIENGVLATSPLKLRERLNHSQKSYMAVYDFIREVYGPDDFYVIDLNLNGPDFQSERFKDYSQKPFVLNKETFAKTQVQELELEQSYKEDRGAATFNFALIGYGAAVVGGLGYLLYYCFH